MFLALTGVVISLAFLVTFAYRGHSVVVVAPIAALIAVVFSGQPIMGSYTQIFMPARGGFIISYFPLFLFGAIFGYLMTSTGLARYLAKGITTLWVRKGPCCQPSLRRHSLPMAACPHGLLLLRLCRLRLLCLKKQASRNV